MKLDDRDGRQPEFTTASFSARHSKQRPDKLAHLRLLPQHERRASAEIPSDACDVEACDTSSMLSVRRRMMLVALAGCLSSGLVRSAETFRLAQWPRSMPVPDFQLVDNDAVPRRLSDYRGKITIIFFGFTHCPDVCPATFVKLAQAMKELGALADRVQVLFVTLDPDRDTSAALKSYVAYFDPRFVGLTGSNAQINAAASSFSVHYAKVAQGNEYSIDHSSGIYVCDGTGRLRLVGTLATRVADWTHDISLLAAP
jgi:protein SCO1